jgi:hypothetical protein
VAEFGVTESNPSSSGPPGFPGGNKSADGFVIVTVPAIAILEKIMAEQIMKRNRNFILASEPRT